MVIDEAPRVDSFRLCQNWGLSDLDQNPKTVLDSNLKDMSEGARE
jgi:hypothetical protein